MFCVEDRDPLEYHCSTLLDDTCSFSSGQVIQCISDKIANNFKPLFCIFLKKISLKYVWGGKHVYLKLYKPSCMLLCMNFS